MAERVPCGELRGGDARGPEQEEAFLGEGGGDGGGSMVPAGDASTRGAVMLKTGRKVFTMILSHLKLF